jgi:hypothetical protein
LKKGERNPRNEGVEEGMLILQMGLQHLLEALQLRFLPQITYAAAFGGTAGDSLTRASPHPPPQNTEATTSKRQNIGHCFAKIC